MTPLYCTKEGRYAAGYTTRSIRSCTTRMLLNVSVSLPLEEEEEEELMSAYGQ
jgi:hypothetical protein